VLGRERLLEREAALSLFREKMEFPDLPNSSSGKPYKQF
jgi:hypothetical protein